jgi:hypothetical protein
MARTGTICAPPLTTKSQSPRDHHARRRTSAHEASNSSWQQPTKSCCGCMK